MNSSGTSSQASTTTFFGCLPNVTRDVDQFKSLANEVFYCFFSPPEGPFEKLTQVSFITQLTGKQYSDKVAENCIAFWKSIGAYGASEARAIDWFLDVFKDQSFPPGSSIFFTHLSNGSYVISFSKHESIPEVGNAVIENNELAEAVLETIIGNGGVSPAARKSLATRLAEFMKLEKIDF
ncbi:hypothetical protein CDL15_Pgr022664 [Punica granatum]|uniref:Chalcone-flavonone isomerase family protein n=1 Tax=Punica granatum TaxID=22663 RepID=A0A218XTH2_PUNGR|nr:hypothetical protein CDL15_Pgr022664 [Punica granatum]